MTERSSLVHCRSCLGHLNGSDQSSRMATRVFGTVFGVRSGCSKGANEGAGVESIHIESLAKMSS